MTAKQIQVTFDAADPRALSAFWRETLGYVFPPPPGVQVPEGAEVMAAWDEFLDRAGVPEANRNSMSAIEDPAGVGRACSSSRSVRRRPGRTACTLTYAPLPVWRGKNA